MSVEKLELKHLEPYIPYRLRGELKGLVGLVFLNTFAEVITIESQDCRFKQGNYSELKPILRPLSDLLNHDLDWWIDLGEEMGTMHTDSIVDSIINDTHYSMDYKRWCKLTEWLYKNHFDMDDLIVKCLAIDINTLD